MHIKINVILNMKNKILQLSHPTFKLRNLHKLFNLMKLNSYPDRLLRKLIFSTPSTRRIQIEPANTQEIIQQLNTPRFVTLPNVPILTMKLTPILQQVCDGKIVFKSIKTVKNCYTKLKDKTPTLQQSGVVYLIPCQECPLQYIGQTSRNLSGRITSHRSDIKRKVTSCALSKHAVDTKHAINYDQVQILDIERNSFKRTFLEMVRIAQTEETMNYRKDLDKLSYIYSHLLDLDKKTRSNAMFSSQGCPDTIAL